MGVELQTWLNVCVHLLLPGFYDNQRKIHWRSVSCCPCRSQWVLTLRFKGVILGTALQPIDARAKDHIIVYVLISLLQRSYFRCEKTKFGSPFWVYFCVLMKILSINPESMDWSPRCRESMGGSLEPFVFLGEFGKEVAISLCWKLVRTVMAARWFETSPGETFFWSCTLPFWMVYVVYITHTHRLTYHAIYTIWYYYNIITHTFYIYTHTHVHTYT